jgi:hypothetical protein
MSKKFGPFLEYASEATAACLITMVQGNMLVITLGHLVVASQTGVVAGAIAAISLLMAKVAKPAAVSIVLGLATTVVDFFVHPAMFGPVAVEAIVTGIIAGGLSYGVGMAVRSVRARRTISQ